MFDVAIVNHNTCEYLRGCLDSIEREPASQVVVVDNASTDGSQEMVETEFPRAVLQANPANPGYGAAANQAIALCGSPYILLLNSDTRLQPGALGALSAYLDSHPRAAIVGPLLLNLNGSVQPSCYSFPTPLHVFLEETTLIRLLAALPVVRQWFARTQAPDRSRVVGWVLGAVLAVRREAFEAVNGFDEGFFMYAEEVDLCYRLQRTGWETHFTPTAAVFHVGGASTRQRRVAMTVQYYMSLMLFYRRHYSKWRQAQLMVMMKGIVLARWLRDTCRLRFERESCQRAKIAQDLDAWRKILWSRPSAGPVKG
jgi:N-acetylglucosaminyl-diphospho-decaprenol L-rhamnosyltransferase